MRWFISILVSLQILLSMFGQGAITLCVRQDGTQKLHWTWMSNCHAHDHDEDSSDNSKVECVTCTDYSVVAGIPLPLTIRQTSFDAAPFCCSIDLAQYLFRAATQSVQECYGLPPPWGLLSTHFIILQC